MLTEDALASADPESAGAVLNEARRFIREKRGLPHGISSYVVLWALQRGLCFHCGTAIQAVPYRPKSRPSGYTIDHLLPKSWGRGRKRNVVLSCRKCNAEKADSAPSADDVARAKLLWGDFGRITAASARRNQRGGAGKENGEHDRAGP